MENITEMKHGIYNRFISSAFERLLNRIQLKFYKAVFYKGDEIFIQEKSSKILHSLFYPDIHCETKARHWKPSGIAL